MVAGTSGTSSSATSPSTATSFLAVTPKGLLVILARLLLARLVLLLLFAASFLIRLPPVSGTLGLTSSLLLLLLRSALLLARVLPLILLLPPLGKDQRLRESLRHQLSFLLQVLEGSRRE